MQRTRKEALDEFLGFVGEADDPVARNVAERELINAIDAVAKAHTWLDYTSPAPYELTLVVNQRSYALPDYFARLQYFRLPNLTTYGHVDVIAKQDADRMFPRAGTSLEVANRPCHAVIAGKTGVQTQPATTGDALEVLSNNAADTDIYVTIAGRDASGVWQRSRVTLNGTTPVAAGTWSAIDEFGKSYGESATPATELTTSRGTVTLRKVTGGATIQSLLPSESAREHQVLTFYPKPSSADVISIPFIRKPKRPIYDSDPLPDGWWLAIEEEMLIKWRVNTGELANDSGVPRPQLKALIENDNIARPAPRIQGFCGW